MTVEFKLPDLGENIESADVAQVLVSEGDEIQAEQVVLELETEKAVFELPCPHAGKVTKIHVKEGDTVPVGAKILSIEPAEGNEAKGKPSREKKAGKPSDKTEEPAAKKEAGGKSKGEQTPPAAEPEEEPEPGAAGEVEESEEDEAPLDGEHKQQDRRESAPKRGQDGRKAAAKPADEEEVQLVPAPASPATRRLARELGVDLHRVTGTGPGGRISAEDVQAHVRKLTAGSQAGTDAPEPTLPNFSQYGPIERKSLNKIARTAAANLQSAWRYIPHVTQHELADITDLETGRKKYMQALGASSPKITMTVLALKAAVAALKAYPHFNASLDLPAGEVVLKYYYHVGIAVDTEHGLLVPVVRDVDKKSIVELARAVTELAARARSRKIDLADLRGATFTISNLGGIGGTAFTPIVNFPEVAILGMSQARWQMSMHGGEPKMRLLLPLSLSYDHRVINGADAARFTAKLASLLSDPIELLIEG